MKNLGACLVVLLGMACSKSATVDAPASDAPATVEVTEADTPSPTDASVRPDVAPRPQLPQTVSMRPASANPSFTIQGCASATRSRAPQDDGHDLTEAVHVGVTTAGVSVSHKVRHACCLKGAVSTSVEGNVVTVREQLTGSPCRCMCGSGIETLVPLPPGDYDVKVVVEAPNSKPREVASQRVSVKAVP